jgi:hypothetical protein
LRIFELAVRRVARELNNDHCILGIDHLGKSSIFREGAMSAMSVRWPRVIFVRNFRGKVAL